MNPSRLLINPRNIFDIGFELAEIFTVRQFCIFSKYAQLRNPWIYTVSFCIFGNSVKFHSKYLVNMHSAKLFEDLCHSMFYDESTQMHDALFSKYVL